MRTILVILIVLALIPFFLIGFVAALMFGGAAVGWDAARDVVASEIRNPKKT